ncbi:dickkopf-related protein 1 [Acipenser ruthenus]|uniref:dickkopf-related protein 1 n=1 Tax=Acipenser ruthenus TaxID=7906 RepID=UPI001560B89D|nr:dickkopf-related protein 1 [Acipenser ruthenus]
MYLKTARILVAVSIVLSCYLDAGSGFSNSNSIKNLSDGALNPSHPVSATPGAIAHDSGSQNQAIDTYQNFYCVEDQNCADGEFCYRSRGVCLSCRKRRKRCLRDAMCCPGNHCSNGLCLPNEGEAGHHAEIEETIIESFAHEDHHFTMEPHPRRTTMPTKPHSDKGQEGDVCLRSSDCSEGLCCARHFWSKICKPVLKEGQVCTKHKRKGTHGLEIFQRCDCGDGLACRTQKGEHLSKSSRLHTCQGTDHVF